MDASGNATCMFCCPRSNAIFNLFLLCTCQVLHHLQDRIGKCFKYSFIFKFVFVLLVSYKKLYYRVTMSQNCHLSEINLLYSFIISLPFSFLIGYNFLSVHYLRHSPWYHIFYCTFGLQPLSSIIALKLCLRFIHHTASACHRRLPDSSSSGAPAASFPHHSLWLAKVKAPNRPSGMMSARLHGCRCISVWEQQKLRLGSSTVAAGDVKAKLEVDFTAD